MVGRLASRRRARTGLREWHSLQPTRMKRACYLRSIALAHEHHARPDTEVHHDHPGLSEAR
jgi:hypothetical protein